MSTQVTLEAGEKVERKVSLNDIVVSHNPRHSLRGVLARFHAEAKAGSPADSRKAFVSYIKSDFPNIASLRVSIEKYGLLQPPVIRAFRAKSGDEYVQRYGIVLGESRILAYALIEAETDEPQVVRCRIEPKMTVDTAFEQGLAENIDRADMNPVDLAEAFHEMLTERINPESKTEKKPQGRPYTLKELAKRVNKTYWWVRDHEAIFYLSDKVKAQCIKDFNEGKRNATRFCKLGLQAKAQATGVPVDSDSENPDNVPVNTEPKKRRVVLGMKSVQGLLDATPLDNTVRLATLAEVMGLDMDTALSERKAREEERAAVEARKTAEQSQPACPTETPTTPVETSVPVAEVA